MGPSVSLRTVTAARWFGYVVAAAAVILVSGLIGVLERSVHVANISMLYLIAVLATAIAFGRGPAILASLAGFLTFNWFFVQPMYTFHVAEPAEWLALLLFLVTAIITGHLAAAQRRRARDAEQREREAVVLYDTVRLMGDPDLDEALRTVAERLRGELGLAAVLIDLSEGGGRSTRAEAGEADGLRIARSASRMPARVLAGGNVPTGGRPGMPGHWTKVIPPRPRAMRERSGSDRLHIVPVGVRDRRVGALLVVRPAGAPSFDPSDDRLLSAVAAQIGSAVERARLRSEATEAEVLRAADELKTALLNAVSHDLRTPLASIIASAGSLRQSDVDWTPEEREEFAQAIEEEGRRLDGIVGNLLDLSRMEGGALRPHKEWYDVGALVDDVLGRLRPTTGRHRVVADIPDDLPPVPLDYVEIDQALSNLIENAAKYAAPGTEIRVTARESGRYVRVEVRDEGPGIAQDSLPHVFEPFYRAVTGESKPQGTGLGLAVTKGLVEAHGGQVAAESLPGRGARFCFTLPLSAPEEATAASARDAR